MKMAEMVDRPGSGIERVALVIGRGGSDTGARVLRRPARRARRAARDAQAGADPVPRRARRRAGPALRGHPAPPPAAGPRGGGVDRPRARAARAGARRGPTCSSTPASSTRTSCAPASSRSSGPRTARACRRRSSRSATSTASRSTSTSCSTAASCPTRTGSRSSRPYSGLDEPVRSYVLGQPESAAFLDEGRRPAHEHPAGLRARGEVVPDDRHRLHGRPPPLGGARRGVGGPPRRARSAACPSSTGTSTVTEPARPSSPSAAATARP